MLIIISKQMRDFCCCPPEKKRFISILRFYNWTELGTRQRCRDIVTKFSGQTIAPYCIMAILILDTPITEDTEAFLRKQ